MLRMYTLPFESVCAVTLSLSPPPSLSFALSLSLSTIVDRAVRVLSLPDRVEIVKLLRQLADEGCTVLSVVHQPSSEVFDAFDRVSHWRGASFGMCKVPWSRTQSELTYSTPPPLTTC